MQILKVRTENRCRGDIGEEAAAEYLKSKGYRILERNYVSGGYEIDIIAENNEYTVFAEVKSRTPTHSDKFDLPPCAAVTKEKQYKIIRAATGYSYAHKSDKRIRFDVVEVYLANNSGKASAERIHHIEGAFDGGAAKDYFKEKVRHRRRL